MFDLIVIGAGPGGYPAAIKAASVGKKVAIIEKDKVGGTCLHRGCIPTKTLLHTTELYRELVGAQQIGLVCDNQIIDFQKLWEHKESTIDKLQKGIEQHFKKNNITFLQGEATILTSNEVQVTNLLGEKEVYSTTNILVATGSYPTIPPIKGIELENVLTSDIIFNQNRLGKDLSASFQSVTIIGGGVIGMELATIYSSIGSRVTVLEGLDRVLANFDKEVAQNLKMILKKRNVNIISGATVCDISKQEGQLVSTYLFKDKEQQVQSDGVIVCVGRSPNTMGLFDKDFLHKIEFNKKHIKVNGNYQTSVDTIYAIGDVIGGMQLAHVATHQGLLAVRTMFALEEDQNMEVIPSCVYTSPEIASVGITAEQAKTMGMEVLIGKHITSTNGKSMLSLQERGFIKIIACKSSHQILGCQMMCARATDMIGELSVAIANKLTIEDIQKVIRAHPTYEEGVGEALENMK